MKRLRFFIDGPQSPDSFSDNVAFTLRKMGHEVVTSKPRSWAQNYSRVRRVAMDLYQSFRQGQFAASDRKHLRNILDSKADIYLSCTELPHPEVVAELRRRKIPPILWWGDSLANNRHLGIFDPNWAFVFIKEPALVQKLRLGGTNAHFLPEAMNPEWHKPVAERSKSSIAVVGNYYAFRQVLCDRLFKAGIEMDLFGTRPPRWALPSIRQNWSGKFVTGLEKSAVFSSALACLNSFAVTELDSLNCRAFEIAGAGGLQLIESRPAVSDCFEPGKELLVYATFEELLQHIEWIHSSPSEANKVAKAGTKRALAEHTYEHRLNKILSLL